MGWEVDCGIHIGFSNLKTKKKTFRNNGDLTFTEVGTDWGFHDEDMSFGMALADLNNNGVQDLILNRMNDPSVIYKNTAPGARIAIRLFGEPPNTQAVGARVELSGGPVESQTKQIESGGDYLSGSDPLVVFAADTDNDNHRLVIIWPDGTKSSLNGLCANRIYEIDESSIGKQPLTDGETISRKPLFIDATDQLGHVHPENTFDDFDRAQPMLPIKLSQLGPGVAWLDLNQNGREDLLIGSGKGGSLAGFENQGNGVLSSINLGWMHKPVPGDQTGIVGWSEHEHTHLVIGNMNYEQAYTDRNVSLDNAPSGFHIQLKGGEVVRVDTIPGVLSATGPLAAADYTGNGRIDLFVGGRFLPGRYPMDATSRLFRNEQGRLVADEVNSSVLEDVELVTSAMFVDYNRNGSQDLVIVTEWGSLRLFENNGGRFTERTVDLGLGEYKGWWQGVASGDFNGNGYPDMVVTNWGENSPYQIDLPEKPLKMFYDDFTWNGRVDIMEAYYDEKVDNYVPRWQMAEYESIMGAIFHIESNREFATSSVEEILWKRKEEIPSKEINTLQHMVFLNEEGKGFKGRPLPVKTQLSTGFYVGVADFDNDGNEDIFMAQNFFGVRQPESKPRQDAGRGLLLRGDGQGVFEAIPGHISGIKVYGEQRGAALGDFIGNGRFDLVVSQNSGETRLFKNQTEKAGIHVKLVGPPSNTLGIGSSVRLIYEDVGKGPMRTIQAGSGYWSQNSTIQILGMARTPTAIEVFWYDGEYTMHPVDIEKQLNYIIEHPESS